MKPLATLALLALAARLAAAAPPPPDVAPVPARPQASTLQPGWQHGAFMEIFVRGYQDSNGDGIGDLRGLTSRLDYLKDLGIKGLWLMPITASADRDHGYATTDFRALEPDYGTLADFDAFIQAAHRRGIGVIIDYTLNHAAQGHALFQQARQGPTAPYRDWFVWADPARPDFIKGWDIWGKNPWIATPTGTYFGTFGPHMPDFNMRNPAVVEYHESSLRWWLNRGLDGFRLDAVPHLVENDAVQWNDQPESRALTHRFQLLIASYPQRYTVCEATAKPLDYAAPGLCGSAFAFGLEGQVVKAAKGDAQAAQNVADFFKTAPASMATMLSNHDIFAGERAWDQFGGDERRYKLAAATYLLLPGTPFIYYGEEIGQAGVKSLEGDGPLRAPMSWTKDGGFTASAQPFRPLSPNRATHNVADQARDRQSLLTFYKAMLKLRNTRPSIAQGSYENASAEGGVLRFERRLGRERTLVVINYTASPVPVPTGAKPLYPARVGKTLAPLSVNVFPLKP